jgi:hypothetical protein
VSVCGYPRPDRPAHWNQAGARSHLSGWYSPVRSRETLAFSWFSDNDAYSPSARWRKSPKVCYRRDNLVFIKTCSGIGAGLSSFAAPISGALASPSARSYTRDNHRQRGRLPMRQSRMPRKPHPLR